ncbi:MAG: Uma2 family endonuclease, partial [Candidatus Eremiobacteraeota bacterium]|nr:Uma2 family endonuclease [Candidatus Eremiobacteraeota bacterium]
MAQAATLEDSDYPPEPDVSNLVTEDEVPVDNPFSEKQQRLLVGCLDESWTDQMRDGRPFVAFANVGLYFSPDLPPVVPDVQVSLDVTVPADLWEKKFRSYMTWAYGKPPELVLEIVSGNEGGETDKKFATYANQGIAYYAIFDPQAIYSVRPLRVYELHARKYVELLDPSWLPDLGLGIQLWDGIFSGYEATWLRWLDQDGRLLPIPAEMVEQARTEADQARTEADQARTEADQ